MYWRDVEPLCAEVNATCEEMLAESKALAEALRLRWRRLKELWRSGCIDWKQYEEARAQLETKA